MRRLLALPGFGRLSAAYALNELAWFVGTLSLSLLVYRRTGSALGSAAFFLCSQGVPALVAPAIVGRLDRVSPRVLLPALYWTEAALFGLLAWLAHRFVLAPVLVVVVVDGAIALVARSLAGGARTEILKPVDLVREGGALQSGLFSAAYLLGPLLGGAVAASGGTIAALIVNSGLFAAIGVSLLSDTIPGRIVHDGPAQRRLRAALAYARRTPTVANLLGLQTIAFVCFSIPTPIEVVLTTHTLHAGSTAYGGLLAAWGGGAVLGSFAYARWRHSSIRGLIAVSTLLLAAGFAVMGLAPSIALALVGAAVAGVANGVAGAAFITELMEVTPQSWTALVASLGQSVGVLAPATGVGLGGVLASLLGVRVTFLIAAAGCLTITALTLYLLVPSRMAVTDGAEEDLDGARPVDPAPPPEPETSALA